MIVTLKQPAGRYPDLTPSQPYAVIGLEADDLRILNDPGQPYLYPSDQFDMLDARQPQDWLMATGDNGEHHP